MPALENEKREKFARAYAGVSYDGKFAGRGSASAIAAGYSEHNAAPRGSKLLKDPLVRARVDELAAAVAERHLSDAVENDTDHPDFPVHVLRRVAHEGSNEAARARSAELLLKLDGRFNDGKLDVLSLPDSTLMEACGQLWGAGSPQARVLADLLKASKGERVEPWPETDAERPAA